MADKTTEQGPLYIHYVKVRHALAAIKKYTERRTLEIGQRAQSKLEGIKQEKEQILQNMKSMQLKEDEAVSLDRFQTFLTYEQKLYELHAKSLESAVKEMTDGLEETVKDCLQFYKVKFWDPKHEHTPNVEPNEQTQSYTKQSMVIAMYVLLTIIPVSVYYLTKFM